MVSFNDVLSAVKPAKLVNLSHQIDENSPYFSLLPDLKKKDASTLKDGFHVQKFSVVGQYGMYTDAPTHFVAGGKWLDEIPLENLPLPLCAINKSDAVAANPNYELIKQDILAFEKYHGKIPPESLVAFRSDWSERWSSQEALTNLGEDGVQQTPGWLREALEFLIRERHVKAIGHETFDMDSGQAVTNANGRPQQGYYVPEQGMYQAEVLTNLDKLPPTGALTSIAYPNQKETVGSPVRAIAYIFENDVTD